MCESQSNIIHIDGTINIGWVVMTTTTVYDVDSASSPVLLPNVYGISINFNNNNTKDVLE